ncbi:MAG: HAMP domain-containing histidine kinase [Tannerellaceae bacterium]|nr:HAMP domain-containing histidine kinase [Tannerellaceae bacterium]
MITVVSFLFYFFMSCQIDRLYYSLLDTQVSGIVHKAGEKDKPENYASVLQSGNPLLTGVQEIFLPAGKSPEITRLLSRYLSAAAIKKLYAGKVIHFRQGGRLGVACYDLSGQEDRIVLVMAENPYGKSFRMRLGCSLVAALLFSTFFMYGIGKRYATRMLDTIAAAYKSEKDFISNASHEINNPLTAIQGECEITLLKERTPAEYEASLRRIATETKRIVQLMKHLLFLSHGDREILKNVTEPVMLANFLMQFLDNRIHFSPDTFAFVVHANPHLLKIAISNLIQNALKYSGDQPVEIRLRGHVLEIEDQGIGIPPEELESIYQPFYRASNTREFKGHGIGLSLSLRILTIYGAQLKITSTLGSGTLVSISF